MVFVSTKSISSRNFLPILLVWNLRTPDYKPFDNEDTTDLIHSYSYPLQINISRSNLDYVTFLNILISNVQNNVCIKINSCNLGVQKTCKILFKRKLINTTNEKDE